MSCYQNQNRYSSNNAGPYRPYRQQPAQSMVDVAAGIGTAGDLGASGATYPYADSQQPYLQPLPDMAQIPPASITQPQPLPAPIPDSELPETLTEYIYTPGYLRSNIGRLMRVEFLVANNTTDRVGILQEVGASYIVLASLETGSRIMCDLFSIKFVTIIDNQLEEALSGY